ncbi:S-adenosyl-L-methionine-dependent methyltransferase [Cladochytrium replicatum]|nr:S-adenosyl-L-methionine-dependent methyltransferase [Cladochytrium replicatum]
MDKQLRVIEFFSGIGGMHWALMRAHELFPRKSFEVVAALDVNNHANLCYKHNFGLNPLHTGVDFITKETLRKFRADAWLLSPPCQPYTQGGSMLDDKDPRAAAILHLIDLLGSLEQPPDYIFLENVPNFEGSVTRQRLLKQLQECGGYLVDEFLVSPVEIGIPNGRRRYYLRAVRKPEGDNGKRPETVIRPFMTFWPYEEEKKDSPSLSQFLGESMRDVDPDEYLVPDEHILKRHKFRFDIVAPDSTRCSTFTKAYGSHQLVGTGSVLITRNFEAQFDFDDPTTLLPFGLRFFTPKEVQKLHGFPPTFTFPDSITRIQRYRLLGNSLNVEVVARLLRPIFEMD